MSFQEIIYYTHQNGRKLKLRLFDTNNQLQQQPSPCVMFVQGSGFFGGPHLLNISPPYLDALLNNGYSVAQIEHRGSIENGIFPNPLNDITCAIRYLMGNAKDLNLDINKFAMFGRSSGGYFTSMIGVLSTNDNVGAMSQEIVKKLHGTTMGPYVNIFPKIKCAVCFFPPTDLLLMDFHTPEHLRKETWGVRRKLPNGATIHLPHDHPSSPEAYYMGFPIQTKPLEVQLANPLTYVNKKTIPFLLVHGDADGTVPCGQSQVLYKKLTSDDVDGINVRKHKYIEVKGGGHGTPHFLEKNIENEFLDFLEKHLMMKGEDGSKQQESRL